MEYAKILEELEIVEKMYCDASKSKKEIERYLIQVIHRLPEDSDEVIQICNRIMKEDMRCVFDFVTTCVKKKKLYERKYFDLYESWLEQVCSWGQCDIFCYRVLNPMIELYPELYENVKKWTNSKKVFIQRASAVSLIHSSTSFRILVPYSIVEYVVVELMSSHELYLQKGIGWLLKYAYLSYPDEVIKLLIDHWNNMSRLTFRYATEKMNQQLKKEMLQYKGEKYKE